MNVREGWFHTPGRAGDRTLAQQLTGLHRVFVDIRGRTVLDVGCAEGLVGIELARCGAALVHGVELVASHIEVGRRLALQAGVQDRVAFEEADANVAEPPRMRFDVVLMLAVLHKLRDPTAACVRYAGVCADLCVIRLPPKGAPVINDARSGYKPHDIGELMTRALGFRFEAEAEGPFGEWMGYYRRG